MNTFTVTTWNLENLFRNGHEFGPRTAEDYAAKLNSLAQTILSLNPDVLAVQEVGGPEPLADLLALLEDRYPHSLLSTHPDPRGIRVGFVSKLAIESGEEITAFPLNGLTKVSGVDGKGHTQEISSFGRGALCICVRPLPDRPINLINAHLKSKLLTFRSASGQPRFTPRDENERVQAAGLALLRRTAEAVALRAKANELLEDNDQNTLVVLGDLNDGVNAATTQILQGPGGSQIETPNAFNRPDQGDDARLFNLAPLIPEERRFSRIYQGNKELIDHIFVSEEMLPGQPRRKPKVDSGVIANPIPSITDNPAERRGQLGSDHAPITAIFEL
ncbi:MAG: endonuclease/exonuclease/phosphatase family protein [Methylococcales bacterium]|nr:endonuclease/exonuclease/phosphatase family protein [Methylococcales bacterium]